MDNAAKALLIAAGVLFAIIILGFLMYMWTAMGNFATELQEKKELEQIVVFNKQYEAYQRQLLRGNDIASVINKVRDNNKMYPEEKITWQFTLKREIIDVLPADTYSEANKDKYDSLVNNETDFREFKSLYFRCTDIEYSSRTSKVNKIVFEEILYEELFED